MAKHAHPPLLPPGRHVMRMDDLHKLAVLNFPTSATRSVLFQELSRLHSDLEAANVVCELWIDGSFLTEKIDPNDIDLTFSCFASDFDNLDQVLRNDIMTILNGGKQYSKQLDTYICFRFLRTDPRSMADNTNYWSEKWGIGWDDYLTGFVVIKLGETDVGLNLFA